KYFDNTNLDLMFALPDQSQSDWENTLKSAIGLAPTHISAYSLIIEEGTPFYDKYEPVDEKLDRSMYYAARDMLAENGYEQYEISNFAKSGFECKHNLVYWQGGDYKGFGLGAASLINNKRLKNTEDMREYLDGATVTETVTLDKTEQMQEFAMLGLRCTLGISAAKFKDVFGADIYTVFGDILHKHEKAGLLEINGDNIRLTEKGIDLSNMVFVDLV
ncbi:MAG: coproporphyrinogen III oxidase, partial [Firmicutes bacterium]|nr:coproporphyrinogen III oxidase [Bacillota bacterium]